MQWQSSSPPGLLLAVALALPPLAGCMDSLPSAPSELTEGIIVYEDANYQGSWVEITDDVSDLADLSGPCQGIQILPEIELVSDWDDCISSVRVAPGWKAILYRGNSYRDDALEITSDMADLVKVPHDCPEGGLNDCVTSIDVIRQ
jgi:hypothetical protein